MLNPTRLTPALTFRSQVKVEPSDAAERRYLEGCAETAAANDLKAADTWAEYKGIVDVLAPYDLGPEWDAFKEEPEPPKPTGIIGVLKSLVGY